MPLNAKGGKKSRSVKKGRVAKSQIKYNRKTNYRKASKKPGLVPPGIVECAICYEPTSQSKDNSVTCGKTTHAVCLACKKQIEDRMCPMCRSHKMYLPPVVGPSREPQFLAIYSKGSRLGTSEYTKHDEKALFGVYGGGHTHSVTAGSAECLIPHHIGWG